MPALTFETLSAEITQALRAQSDTPPETTARCTLGRDKVMVLVEYPPNSVGVEAIATQTLDWLESALRDQFDTKGLPDTAADLAEGGAEASVQLFLKHLSEAKPFTMRSFIWKVEDGFDDLFGSAEGGASPDLAQPLVSPASEELSAQSSAQSSGTRFAGESRGDYVQPVFQRANGTRTQTAVIHSETAETTQVGADLLPNAVPSTDADVESGIASLNTYEEADEPIPVELEDEHLPLELEPEPDFEAELGAIPHTEIGVPDIAPDIEASLEDELTLSDSLTLNSPLTEDVALESDLAAELEADLAADLSSGLSDNTAASHSAEGEAMEFSLPGEAPELADEEFNLPTLELPGARVPDIGPADAAFFNIDSGDAVETNLADPVVLDLPLPNGPAEATEASAFFEASGLEAQPDPEPEGLDSRLATEEENTAEEVEAIAEADYSEESEFDEIDTDALSEVDALLEVDTLLTADSEGTNTALNATTDNETDDEVDLGEAELSLHEANDEALELADPELPDSESANSELAVDSEELESETPETTDSELASIHSELAEPGINNLIADEASASDHELSAHAEPTLPKLTPPASSAEADSTPTLEDLDSEASEESAEDELREYDPEAYENQYEQAGYEEDLYEDDPTYYLDEEEAVEEEPFEDVAAIEEGEVQRQREQWQKQSKRNPWIFAGAAGFALVGVIGFIATRPCTVGTCDRIQTAQITTEEAIRDLRTDDSLDSVLETKKQIKHSIGLLKPIPVWSPYYREAQSELPYYQSQVQALDLVASAQGKAYRAALESQNPPHPVARWQKIANDWLAATESLKTVPLDSPVRELADRKLSEYRANRATILVRIDAESKAEVGLRQAQNNASIGTKQLDGAASAEDWEEALASWEAAVNNLSQIPQGTNAYAEAQQLLPEYREKLDEVRVRAEREVSANERLVEAKQLAAAAQRTEAEEQWSISIDNWRRAQGELRGIPEGTLAFAEAKALLRLYGAELGRSENNIQAALKFQAIEPNFFAACGVTATQMCTYSVRNGKIRMDLFEGYDSVIDQSITPPDQRPDQRAASNVSDSNVSGNGAIQVISPQFVDTGNQLLRNITLLGTQAQVPIELYDAQGKLLATYRPALEGFTR